MKQKKIPIAVFLVVIMILAALLFLPGCAQKNEIATPSEVESVAPAVTDLSENNPPEADISGVELLPGVTVSEPFPYSGKYVEDGSDDAVENIAAVRLTNVGATDYLYLEFSVTTSDGDYAFTASSVHVGTVMTVLCKEKKTCSEGESVLSVDCPIHAEYQTPPTMCEDQFSFVQAPGSFSIKNISGQDLNGKITVYYKSTDENGYLGGITFRTVLNGMKADAEEWMPSGHMGQIVFVTYEE